MTKHTFVPIIIAAVIAVLLGAGYAIVVQNGANAALDGDVPTGFFH